MIVVALIVVAAVGGIAYFTISSQAAARAQATTTAQANMTATFAAGTSIARGNITATAVANAHATATTLARANATATAVGIANATATAGARCITSGGRRSHAGLPANMSASAGVAPVENNRPSSIDRKPLKIQLRMKGAKAKPKR